MIRYCQRSFSVYIQAKIEYSAKSSDNSVNNFQLFEVSGNLSGEYDNKIILNGLMMKYIHEP